MSLLHCQMSTFSLCCDLPLEYAPVYVSDINMKVYLVYTVLVSHICKAFALVKMIRILHTLVLQPPFPSTLNRRGSRRCLHPDFSFRPFLFLFSCFEKNRIWLVLSWVHCVVYVWYVVIVVKYYIIQYMHTYINNGLFCKMVLFAHRRIYIIHITR